MTASPLGGSNYQGGIFVAFGFLGVYIMQIVRVDKNKDGELCIPLSDEILALLKAKIGDKLYMEVKDGKLYVYKKDHIPSEPITS